MWVRKVGKKKKKREERNEYHHFLGKKTRLGFSQNVKMPAKYSFFF